MHVYKLVPRPPTFKTGSTPLCIYIEGFDSVLCRDGDNRDNMSCVRNMTKMHEFRGTYHLENKSYNNNNLMHGEAARWDCGLSYHNRTRTSLCIAYHYLPRSGNHWQSGLYFEGRAGQGRTGQDRAGQGRAGQGRAGQGRAGQGRAGQGRGNATPDLMWTCMHVCLVILLVTTRGYTNYFK